MLGKIEEGHHKRIITYEKPKVREVNALKYELERFVESVQKNVEPPVTGRDGLHALEVAEEILQKIKSQKMTVA